MVKNEEKDAMNMRTAACTVCWKKGAQTHYFISNLWTPEKMIQ